MELSIYRVQHLLISAVENLGIVVRSSVYTMNFCAARIELMTRMVSRKWASSEVETAMQPSEGAFALVFGASYERDKSMN